MGFEVYNKEPISREHLDITPVPAATRSWCPIRHSELLGCVERTLPKYGLSIREQSHQLTHEGHRYFGMLRVENGSSNPEYTRVVGLRNSHDKRFCAGLVCGIQVLVCSNLSFSGEIQIGRKHTVFIMNDLPDLVNGAINKLVEDWNEQDKRIELYKGRRLNKRAAHDLTIRALDAGAITARDIPGVLQEYREPKHEVFKKRNLWSWLNSVTETLKSTPMTLLPQRTQALHSLCDEYAA